MTTANLRTSTTSPDFRGFYSSRILGLRRGILMSVENFPEMLSQRILVGIILVGRLGVQELPPLPPLPVSVKKTCLQRDGGAGGRCCIHKYMMTLYDLSLYIYIYIYIHICADCQIKGWRAVSAAGLQGKGSCKRSCNSC